MRSQSRNFGLIGSRIDNQVQFQLPAGLNYALGAVGIAFAGQLNDNFVFSLAIRCNQRLRQAQRVNAAPNGFLGLIHGLLLDSYDSRLFHGDEVTGGLAGSGGNIPIGKLIVNQIACGSGLFRSDVMNQNLRVA